MGDVALPGPDSGRSRHPDIAWERAFAALGLPTDASLGTRKTIPADQVVISEGRPTRRFVLVVCGQLCVCGANGQVGSIQPGEWCGEIGLLGRLRTNDGRATATVRTGTTTDVVTFAPWEFKALIDTYPEVENRVKRTARSRIDHYLPTWASV